MKSLAQYLADCIEQASGDNDCSTYVEIIEKALESIEGLRVICECGAIVELKTVGGQYQYIYEGTCPKCKTMWQLKDVISECDEEIEIGEHGYDVEDEV